MNEAAVPGDYPQGVKLGVDVGTVRVGVAVCDRDGILATPLRTLERNAKKNTDVRILAALAVELGVGGDLRGPSADDEGRGTCLGPDGYGLRAATGG